MCYRAVRLPPDFRAGRVIVRVRIKVIVKLIRLERAGDLRRKSVGDAVVGLGRIGRYVAWRYHDVGAVRAQQIDLFLRHLVGHYEDASVSANGGGHGKAGARVSAGRFDDGAARLEQSLRLGGVEHRDRRPILHTSAGIHIFDLRKYEALCAVGNLVQLDQRRVADRFERVLKVGRAGRMGRRERSLP